ncbi:hypothetical protein evm_008128 [Chilo suppressalis]|nr:hypothetical protein evm_008128 [Chilo suppressalis]
MDGVMKRKNVNSHRPPTDRFVALRESFPELRRRLLYVDKEHTVGIWHQKNLRRKRYKNYLDEAFGLEPLKEYRAGHRDVTPAQGWPCVPRKRRCLSSADSVLDLPSYSFAEFPELLDWSNDNILVAALGRDYHKWSWRTQSLISEGFALNEIQCCKFDPRGEMLILGTDVKTVEVHNNLLSKCVNRNYCRCLTNDDEHCSITALDWSPTGNSFITGCSRGMVGAYDRDAQLISWRRATRSAVLVTRVSPDARYVAVCAVTSVKVIMLSWPALEFISRLNSNSTVKTLAWHPWRSALLGVGAVTSNMQTCLALWDTPKAKVQQTCLDKSNYCLDAMLFSQRTGELVLSLWDADPALAYQRPNSHLVVMSNPDTVVDHWGEGRNELDRVRTMIFSPDGTKLATATVDEDLIIWNFLPEDKQKKTNRRRFAAIPVYLDEATHGYSLR